MQGKQTLITSTSKLIIGIEMVIELKTDHRIQNGH